MTYTQRHLAAWANRYDRLTGHESRIPAVGAIDECLPALGDDALVEKIYKYAVGWTPSRHAAGVGRPLDHIRGALALRLGRLEEAEEQWLDHGNTDTGELRELLVPYSVGGMEAYEVANLINKPQNDVAEVVARVD